MSRNNQRNQQPQQNNTTPANGTIAIDAASLGNGTIQQLSDMAGVEDVSTAAQGFADPTVQNVTSASVVLEPAPAAEVVMVSAQVQSTSNGLTGIVAGHIAYIENYIDAMNPRKAMAPDIIARNQVGLFRTIVNLFNGSGDQFDDGFSALLKLFQTHKTGTLSPRAVFRGAGLVALSAEERETFHQLLDMLIITADPKSRATALKQIDLTKTLRSKVIKEQAKQRIMAFYGL